MTDKPKDPDASPTPKFPRTPGKKRNPSWWEKGGPSPNPKGRPPKPKESKLFSRVNRELASFLEADRKVIGATEDGEAITRGESLDLHLFRGAMNDPRLMKLYLERKNLAVDLERQLRETAVTAAIQYQDRYLQHALALEKAGREFKQVPHPLDIHVDGMEVRIDGPVTELERLIVKGVVARRNAIHKGVILILDQTNVSLKFRRELWEKLRRRHYRLEAKLPGRLKRPFPTWVAKRKPKGGSR